MRVVIIYTPAGYVTGFSREHQCVQITDVREDAKRFTPAKAQAFIDKYADAGYGMSEKTATIMGY